MEEERVICASQTANQNKSTIVKQCMSNGAEGHYQFFKDKIPPQITEKMLLKPYLYVPDLGSHQRINPTLLYSTLTCTTDYLLCFKNTQMSISTFDYLNHSQW